MVVGVDVTVVDRIAAALERHPRFAYRIFTEGEQRYSARKAPSRSGFSAVSRMRSLDAWASSFDRLRMRAQS